MKRQVRFDLHARRELLDATSYYESESSGLGTEFLREVERGIAFIVKHPEAGQATTESVRRWFLRRFPYALLYSLRPETVRILAVMHLKRRPMYWAGRE